MASATDVPEGGRLIPPVDMGRTLFRAAAPLVELDTYEVVLHVAVENTVNIFSTLLLVLGGLVITAALRRFRVPWFAVNGVRLGRLLESSANAFKPRLDEGPI